VGGNPCVRYVSTIFLITFNEGIEYSKFGGDLGISSVVVLCVHVGNHILHVCGNSFMFCSYFAFLFHVGHFVYVFIICESI
jgi:hypothetical protein